VMKVRQNDILYKQEIVACVYECPSTELPGGHRLVRAARLLSLLLHSGRGSIKVGGVLIALRAGGGFRMLAGTS
jgi:hypothetical protein